MPRTQSKNQKLVPVEVAKNRRQSVPRRDMNPPYLARAAWSLYDMIRNHRAPDDSEVISTESVIAHVRRTCKDFGVKCKGVEVATKLAIFILKSNKYCRGTGSVDDTFTITEDFAEVNTASLVEELSLDSEREEYYYFCGIFKKKVHGFKGISKPDTMRMYEMAEAKNRDLLAENVVLKAQVDAPPPPHQSIREQSVARQEPSNSFVHEGEDEDEDMGNAMDLDVPMPGSFTTPAKPSTSNYPAPTPESMPRARQPERQPTRPLVGPSSPTPSRSNSSILSSGRIRTGISRSGSFATVPQRGTLLIETGTEVRVDETIGLREQIAELHNKAETAGRELAACREDYLEREQQLVQSMRGVFQEHQAPNANSAPSTIIRKLEVLSEAIHAHKEGHNRSSDAQSAVEAALSTVISAIDVSDALVTQHEATIDTQQAGLAQQAQELLGIRATSEKRLEELHQLRDRARDSQEQIEAMTLEITELRASNARHEEHKNQLLNVVIRRYEAAMSQRIHEFQREVDEWKQKYEVMRLERDDAIRWRDLAEIGKNGAVEQLGRVVVEKQEVERQRDEIKVENDSQKSLLERCRAAFGLVPAELLPWNSIT